MAESISGVVERVTFHSPENGFTVLRVQAKGKNGLVTLVGHLSQVTAGEGIEARGAWVQERDHGLQFKADEVRTFPPNTTAEIERYLGSGLVKGIGPHYARKIVAAFGERTLKVIDESPAFLREVKGIGSRRIQRIRQGWQEQKAVRAIMLFLQQHGVGTARAARIYKTYGERAIEVVRGDPYRLARDIGGIGFKTADQLATRLGIDPASPLRARAAVRYVLQRLGDEGHCGFGEEQVVARTVDLIGVDSLVVLDALRHQIDEGEIAREEEDAGPALYLKPLYLAETGIAKSLRELAGALDRFSSADMESSMARVEERIGLELAPSQRAALRQAITEKLLVITGGPGVGKTTIVRAIVEVYADSGFHISLCAPTGRAAKRLSEATGRPASTIHRLLGYDAGQGGPAHGRERPLEVDLLVVDEVSMVDTILMNRLLAAVPRGASVVLVGDEDQLPSVGPGQVLGDLIASGCIPVARLTEVFRQAEKSLIVRAAHAVHRGQLPESAEDANGDFFMIEAQEPDAILDRVLALVRERVPARFGLDPVRDVQVLTPMNRSSLGARELNIRLQEALNHSAGRAQVDRFGITYRIGDKVLQTVNDYDKDVFNGDIGLVSAIDLVDQEMTVDYDGRQVRYDFSELDELALAYALTVHKSQGSEYPAVIIPLHMQQFLLLQRNLLYTAITRGKRLVVLVGQKKAIRLAVERRDTGRRHTALIRRIRAAMEGPG